MGRVISVRNSSSHGGQTMEDVAAKIAELVVLPIDG